MQLINIRKQRSILNTQAWINFINIFTNINQPTNNTVTQLLPVNSSYIYKYAIPNSLLNTLPCFILYLLKVLIKLSIVSPI